MPTPACIASAQHCPALPTSSRCAGRGTRLVVCRREAQGGAGRSPSGPCRCRNLVHAAPAAAPAGPQPLPPQRCWAWQAAVIGLAACVQLACPGVRRRASTSPPMQPACMALWTSSAGAACNGICCDLPVLVPRRGPSAPGCRRPGAPAPRRATRGAHNRCPLLPPLHVPPGPARFTTTTTPAWWHGPWQPAAPLPAAAGRGRTMHYHYE